MANLELVHSTSWPQAGEVVSQGEREGVMMQAWLPFPMVVVLITQLPGDRGLLLGLQAYRPLAEGEQFPGDLDAHLEHQFLGVKSQTHNRKMTMTTGFTCYSTISCLEKVKKHSPKIKLTLMSIFQVGNMTI